MLSLRQNRKNALDKVPTLLSDAFNLQKMTNFFHFYPTDLVLNTKTTTTSGSEKPTRYIP